MKRAKKLGAIAVSTIVGLFLMSCGGSGETAKPADSYPYTATLDAYPGIAISAESEDVLNAFLNKVIQMDLNEALDFSDIFQEDRMATSDIEVEGIDFEYEPRLDWTYVYIKVRNCSDQKFDVVSLNVDYVDQNGDIVKSGNDGQYHGILEPGQACNIEATYEGVLPYGVRVSSGWVAYQDDFLADFELKEPFVAFKE